MYICLYSSSIPWQEVVVGSLHNWALNNLQPHIWFESLRVIHAFVACVASRSDGAILSSDQTTTYTFHCMAINTKPLSYWKFSARALIFNRGDSSLNAMLDHHLTQIYPIALDYFDPASNFYFLSWFNVAECLVTLLIPRNWWGVQFTC